MKCAAQHLLLDYAETWGSLLEPFNLQEQLFPLLYTPMFKLFVSVSHAFVIIFCNPGIIRSCGLKG